MKSWTTFSILLAILAHPSLTTPLPLPLHSEPFNAGLGPSGTSQGPHGIGYPGDYTFAFRGEGSADADLDNFNNQVYHDGQRYPPTTSPNQLKIPTHISQSPATKKFDEDLSFLDVSVPEAVPVLGAPAPSEIYNPNPKPYDPNNVSGGQEIPASEIALEFPEYDSPKTFSTERVDYNLRTTGPTGNAAPETGEDNSNVAVYSDDKSFHWSGGNGDVFPKQDPQFKEAMGWITGKFRGEKGKTVDGGVKQGQKPAQKASRKSRMSVFDAFGVQQPA